MVIISFFSQGNLRTYLYVILPPYRTSENWWIPELERKIFDGDPQPFLAY